MNKSFPNIEYKKFGRDDYRVGYDAQGYATRIHDNKPHGYICAGRSFKNLASVSDFLTTLNKDA